MQVEYEVYKLLFSSEFLHFMKIYGTELLSTYSHLETFKSPSR
jgi:hypothetical protein